MTDLMTNSVCFTSAIVLILAQIVLSDNDHGKYALSYDTETFKAAINLKRNFIMFYAPWCGHCKNLAPTWDELAKVYNGRDNTPVIISKVDCTVHTKLCSDEEIIGFPTLKLFPIGGIDPKRYAGKRDLESLKSFLAVQLNEAEPEAAETGGSNDQDSQEHSSNVVALTDDDFDDYVASGLHFIKFYAPWCKHCQKLAPTWDQLADTFSDIEDITIAKIDCDANPSTCNKHSIRGYPSLLVFNDGKKINTYEGERNLGDLTLFASVEVGKLSGDVLEEEEAADSDGPTEEDEEPGKVKELTEDNFKSFLSSRLVFVKFYAPWCGHCKRLAPTWDELAKELENEAVSIAKVDCTLHKPVCDEHQVRGYPTLKIFRDGESLEAYRQSRTLDSLVSFARGFLKSHDEL